MCAALAACSRGSNGTTADDGSAPGSAAGTTAGGDAAGGGTGPGGSGDVMPASGTPGDAGEAGAKSGAELPPLPNDTQSGVFVQLFEWRWPDIARECETFLGPKGFTAVQVSPPNEHALLASYAYPWWQRYQPVSYQLESRSGTRAEFADMVARCRKAGVGIYVDALLNHMTAQASGTGSAGTKFTKYAYPDLYTPSDFHSPTCQIQDSDYVSSAEHVQRCELVGLADLDTGSPSVQHELAGYLSDLLGLGVRGFRLDAAKHVAPADLQAILAQVEPRAGEQPFYFLEVIDYGGEAVHASDYLDVGGQATLDVTEFKYKGVGDALLGRGGRTLSSLAQLSEGAWSLLPSERAVVFIDNHDTQRGDANFFQDGAAHELATVFMLAWPYGYPKVISSYGFDRSSGASRDSGPPSDGADTTHPVYEPGASEPNCAPPPWGPDTRGWICEHRLRSVANMVALRRVAADAPVDNLWSDEQNQLAFSRGDRAFVAINHEATPLARSFATGLPAGRYCDVLSGDFTPAASSEPASCSGNVVDVDASGMTALAVPAETAVALHVEARL